MRLSSNYSCEVITQEERYIYVYHHFLTHFKTRFKWHAWYTDKHSLSDSHAHVIFSMQNYASLPTSQHAFYMNKLFTMIASPCHFPS